MSQVRVSGSASLAIAAVGTACVVACFSWESPQKLVRFRRDLISSMHRATQRLLGLGSTQQQIRVLLGSTAAPKIVAVTKALCNAHVVAMKAESGVREQPVGLEETLAGARSRLRALCEQDTANIQLAIAIENGIVRIHQAEEHAECWIDVAVIVVRDLQSGAESIATSCGVQLPTTMVGEWAEAGAEGTVGEYLAAESGCDKQDPHTFLTRGSMPRCALLESAVRLAYATLPPRVQGSDGSA